MTKAKLLTHRNFWQGKRVLITGHTGFKGSWLTLWLSELGAEITGISLEPNTNPNLFTKLGLINRLKAHHIQDIRDIEAVNRIIHASQPHVVFHLAAQPLVRRSYADPLGTWTTNVQGSLNVLEALKALKHQCSVVMVTTDKVYINRDWDYGYREEDRLGGHDPYSASKAACELAIASWRASFCGLDEHQTPHLFIATARAGNVIGGGDWAEERIFPDAMRALADGVPIPLRSPEATRPWQHVLEPLSGYLLLAERLSIHGMSYASAFNFGPAQEANCSVRELIEVALQYWPGKWQDHSDPAAPHEAKRLHLQIDKAYHQLSWRPRWDLAITVARTVNWYRSVHEGENALDCCLSDLNTYQRETSHAC